jgi:hypothetical protein
MSQRLTGPPSPILLKEWIPRMSRRMPHADTGQQLREVRRRAPASPRRVPATAPRVPPSLRRPRATHTSTTTHASRYSHFRRFWLRPALCGTTRGLRQAPRCTIYWKWKGYSSFHLPSDVDGQPPREAAAYGGTSAQEDLLWAYGCLHLEEFRRVTDGTRTSDLL